MRTGLEHISDEAIKTFIINLKSGVLQVVDMGPAAFVANPEKKECPPVAAMQMNLNMLQIFEAEAHKRGMDYRSIGPDLSFIEDIWLGVSE